MMTKLAKFLLPFFLVLAGPAMAADEASAKPQAEDAPQTWPSKEEPDVVFPGSCADFSDPDFRLMQDKDDKEDGKDAKEPPKKNSRIRPESSSCVV